MLNLPGLVCALALAQAGAEAGDIVQPKLRDVSFTAQVVAGYQDELAKINRDFGNSYRVKATRVLAKEPFMIRLESRVGDTEVRYILNGTTRVYSIPRARVNQREDLSEAPGKRQSFLDFGLVTPSMVGGLFEARFVRVDRATGGLVFDLTYLKKWDDTSRHRIWVDREKRYVFRREWYSQSGRLMATFFHENPIELNGIWLPTRVTVRNAEGKVAGIMQYVDLRVNAGLSDSLFSVR
ncbi:MAG: outer membrane lipoprotein-sorting protein [Fimbriimonadales bacterium]|nr:outer membrane lipoprotein-sorting protein [Fimbriimonadales bacterium]